MRPIQLNDLDGDRFKLYQYLQELERELTTIKTEIKKVADKKPTLVFDTETLQWLKSQFQAGGLAPISISSLFGIAAQPQIPQVPKYAALPVLSDPSNFEGRLVVVGAVLYRFNAITPISWDAL